MPRSVIPYDGLWKGVMMKQSGILLAPDQARWNPPDLRLKSVWQLTPGSPQHRSGCRKFRRSHELVRRWGIRERNEFGKWSGSGEISCHHEWITQEICARQMDFAESVGVWVDYRRDQFNPFKERVGQGGHFYGAIDSKIQKVSP